MARPDHDIDDVEDGLPRGEVTRDVMQGVLQFPSVPGRCAAEDVPDSVQLAAELVLDDGGRDNAEGQGLVIGVVAEGEVARGQGREVVVRGSGAARH